MAEAVAAYREGSEKPPSTGRSAWSRRPISLNHFPVSGAAALVPAAEGAARHRLCRARPRPDDRQRRRGRGAIAGRLSGRSGRLAGDAGARPSWSPGSPFLGLGWAPSYRRCCWRWCSSGSPTRCFTPPITRSCRPRSRRPRLGRAFSIHTFAGFLGNAVAPVTMIALGRRRRAECRADGAGNPRPDCRGAADVRPRRRQRGGAARGAAQSDSRRRAPRR